MEREILCHSLIMMYVCTLILNVANWYLGLDRKWADQMILTDPVAASAEQENWRGMRGWRVVASLPQMKVASLPEPKGSEVGNKRSWSYCWPPFLRYWEVKQEGKGGWREEQGSEGRNNGVKGGGEQRQGGSKGEKGKRKQREEWKQREKGVRREKGVKKGAGGGEQRLRMLLTSFVTSLLLFNQAW